MTVLRNARHERFAQEIASGKKAPEAYAAAGYRPSRSHAYELEQNRSVRERVAEILTSRERREAKAVERAIERTAITKERTILELAKIGFANMADYTRLIGSERVVDLSEATRDQLAAVQELTVEDFKDGRGEHKRDVRRIKLKLADKRAALVEIGRELGMFIARKEHTLRLEDQLAAMTPEERAEDARDLLQRVQQRLLEYRQQIGEEAGPVIEGQSEELPRAIGGIGRK